MNCFLPPTIQHFQKWELCECPYCLRFCTLQKCYSLAPSNPNGSGLRPLPPRRWRCWNDSQATLSTQGRGWEGKKKPDNHQRSRSAGWKTIPITDNEFLWKANPVNVTADYKMRWHRADGRWQARCVNMPMSQQSLYPFQTDGEEETEHWEEKFGCSLWTTWRGVKMAEHTHTHTHTQTRTQTQTHKAHTGRQHV